jgi:glycine/D-amino acid oxidase-like deaminating enzyme
MTGYFLILERIGEVASTGHFRDGILLGPLTGHLVAELMQGHATPFGLDLNAFNPDRFGGWMPTALE